jgi:hypothetical protein
MAVSPAEIEEVYFTSLSKAMNQTLLRLVFGGYNTAYEACDKFPPQEARDLRPTYRWVQIRSDLLGLPARFDGIKATSEPYHTRLTAGGIILTAHSVEGPGLLPRDAEYRREYACTSQLDIWEDNDGAYIYAILAHAPDPREPRQPLFADILFPDKHYDAPVHSIKLFEKFPAIVSELRIAKVEEADEPIIKPKKQIKKQNEEAD